jgi:glycerate 2-kinase
MTQPSAPRRLREDARAIWQAGVDAVRADRLVRAALRVEGPDLVVCDERFPVESLGRVAVVGAGKAGAGMAAAVEQVLAPTPLAKRLEGWVNVPADCVRPLTQIHLHAARPAGVNEPTDAGVQGAREILRIVSQLGRDDLCLVLLSGGGSALLPAPKPPITLADKQAVTRHLMHSGATIEELNTVRKRLSLIKGGGLARAATAGRLVAMIISDVVGDPLSTIASGPTCGDATTDAEALAVLGQFTGGPPAVPQQVLDYLRTAAAEAARPKSPACRTPPCILTPQGCQVRGFSLRENALVRGANGHVQREPTPTILNGVAACRVTNHIIGHNATALAAAADRARQLGYHVVSRGSDNRGEASQEGRDLARRCLASSAGKADPPSGDVCLLSGGEPIVDMAATDRPGKGGRNQQLVLAALVELQHDDMPRIAILAGGTDGEDGPTDAAGAWLDAELRGTAQRLQVDPVDYLQRFDAYTFFSRCGGLLITGPTHTNVMDLRVALVRGE